MKVIKEASRACWEGRWYTDTGWHPPAGGQERDGRWNYTDTVHLRAKGPHGPIWWRCGRSEWQPPTDALTNTRTKADYEAREDQRRAERECARTLENQQRREQLEAARPWSCPSCGTDVDTGMTVEDAYRPEQVAVCVPVRAGAP